MIFGFAASVKCNSLRLEKYAIFAATSLQIQKKFGFRTSMIGRVTMNVFQKIDKLTNSKTGLGIPMTIIARYCNCHPNAIWYYIHGATPKQGVTEFYEQRLMRFYRDIVKIMEDREND